MREVVSQGKLRRYVGSQHDATAVVDIAEGDGFFDESEEDTALVLNDDGGELYLDLAPMQEGEEESDSEDLSEIIYTNVSLLQAAYLAGDVERVFALLDDPTVDPNHVCHDGKSQVLRFDMGNDGVFLENMTVLHLAVLDKNVKVVRELCKNKRINVNARANVVPNKHLYYKYDSYCGDYNDLVGIDDYTKAGVIERLWISRDVVEVYRICGVTPFHLAFRVCEQEIIDILVSAGANLDVVDSGKDDPVDYLKQSMRDQDLARKGYPWRMPWEINQSGIDSLIDSLDKLPLRKYKPRLLLGEADFSFSAALLDKHSEARPTLGKVIVATELESNADLHKTYRKFPRNVKFLTDNRATLFYNFDARHVHDDPRLTLARYPRIHFNCPMILGNFSDRSVPRLLADFFQSASQKQDVGDRIHMGLPKETESRKQLFRESYTYGIFDASARAGYRLITKRRFGRQRYPGYEHRKTGSDVSVAVTEDAREFVFEKTSMSYEEIVRQNRPKPYTAYGETNYALPQYDTDDGSSDYEEPKAEAGTAKRQCFGVKK